MVHNAKKENAVFHNLKNKIETVILYPYLQSIVSCPLPKISKTFIKAVLVTLSNAIFQYRKSSVMQQRCKFFASIW